MHSPSLEAPASSALKAMEELPMPRVRKALSERRALQARSQLVHVGRPALPVPQAVPASQGREM